VTTEYEGSKTFPYNTVGFRGAETGMLVPRIQILISQEIMGKIESIGE
jgi:hypothetical protein